MLFNWLYKGRTAHKEGTFLGTVDFVVFMLTNDIIVFLFITLAVVSYFDSISECGAYKYRDVAKWNISVEEEMEDGKISNGEYCVIKNRYRDSLKTLILKEDSCD